MANSKIPTAITIPLSSLDGEEFYAVIIQEEGKNKRKSNNLWLFRKGGGIAHCCFSKIADIDDPTMTVDGIKALDAIGKFDENKEMLTELD